MAGLAQPALPSSLVLVGAGKMGGALLEGWLSAGLNAAGTAILDSKPAPEIETLCAPRGMALNPPLGSLQPPQAVVLAIKPQSLESAACMVDRLIGPETLLVSILAGKTIQDLQRRV